MSWLDDAEAKRLSKPNWETKIKPEIEDLIYDIIEKLETINPQKLRYEVRESEYGWWAAYKAKWFHVEAHNVITIMSRDKGQTINLVVSGHYGEEFGTVAEAKAYIADLWAKNGFASFMT